MSKKLIIVESPTKVKTIKKFLSNTYEVMACQGHIRDLPKSSLGIDVENDFEPKYITIRGKGDLIAKLKKTAKKADIVYLATDPDREGEAISWHLIKALSLDENNYKRITFNEITKNAVKNSINNSRKIDQDLVDAQQARRILDRLVGYSISPLLWAKVKRGLSAGRVQSAALRLICDREAEIDAFIPKEYWSIDVVLNVEGEKQPIQAKFYGDKKKAIELNSKAEVKMIIDELKKASYSVMDIKRSERIKKAPLPFTTSTLQQEASKRLNFSTSKTMSLAQQLYEGIDVKGHGTVGLITYLRTDSIRVSDEAVADAANYIKENYSDKYIGKYSVSKKSNKNIQDAHEAIRPSNISLAPVIVKESLSRDQFRLYQLIWTRFLSSMMSNAVYDSLSISITANDHYVFKVNASTLKFDGFLAVYKEDETEDEKKLNSSLKNISMDSKLSFKNVDGTQHFTNPPPHYSEAGLVKELEEQGIGRPSTYAPTIYTLISRRYIVKENKLLYVSQLGEVINSIMTKSFPDIVNIKFTAKLEDKLDKVEENTVEWKDIIREFYPSLKNDVDKAQKEIESIKLEDELSDEVCDKCGRRMVIKYGPHGKFLACPGFPECRNAKPYFEKIGVKCPKCSEDIVIRKTKKGRTFYGCISYPSCDYTSWQKPTSVKCGKCGSLMLQKGKKLVCENMECRNTLEQENSDTAKKSKK